MESDHYLGAKGAAMNNSFAGQSYAEPPINAKDLPLTAALSERLAEAIRVAGEACETLVQLRDRLYGPQPEVSSTGNSATRPALGHFAAHANDGHDELSRRLYRVNALATEIANRT